MEGVKRGFHNQHINIQRNHALFLSTNIMHKLPLVQPYLVCGETVSIF